MRSAADHLRDALTALRRDRDELDRQIKIIENTIKSLSGETDSAPLPDDGTRSTRPVPAVRDIVLDFASSQDDYFSLTDVVDVVHAAGNDSKYESISSVVARMVNADELARGPRRGTYGRVGVHDMNSGNAEGPAVTGPSDSAYPQGDEGGDRDADHGADHHRPAVAGGSDVRGVP